MWTRYRHPVGNLPLLAGVPRSVVRRLGSLMTQVTVPAGQVIVTDARILLQKETAAICDVGGIDD